MWFTVVYERNGKTNVAPEEICIYARSEDDSQIEEAICTISTEDELGHAPKLDGATLLNNDTDSREDGRTSLPRQKTEAHDGENGSLDTRETKLNERESDQCVEMRTKTIDQRRSLVTELQLSNISEDVGNFWRELAPKLGIPSSKVQNLDEDCRCNWDKANSLLIAWKQKNGKGATAGLLSDALESIGRKNIAERLLEMCHENLSKKPIVDEGDVISLTVLDSNRNNKPILCKDTQGNLYVVKPLSKREEFRSSDFDEAVAVSTQGVAMETEQTSFLRQNSLIRTRSGVQELRRQLKKVKIDSGNEESSDKVQSGQDRDDTKPNSNHSSVDEWLRFCEEQCSSCEGITVSLIKLICVVAGEMMKDNSKCIHPLLELTMELKDRESTFFSRIESAHNQIHRFNKNQIARLEQLEKWRREQKQRVEEVEKLLSYLLYQGNVERKQSQWKLERSQRTKTDLKNRHQSMNECSGVDDIMVISEPLLFQRMTLMKTCKRFNKERRVISESQL